MLEVEKPADMKAHIGEKIGSSEWVLVDQAMITNGSTSMWSGRSARCLAGRRSRTAT